MGLATLFVGFGFAGGRLAAWTRWLFVMNGIGGLIGFVVFALQEVLPDPVLIVGWAGLGIWNVTFPAATVLAAFTIRRSRSLGESAAEPARVPASLTRQLPIESGDGSPSIQTLAG
jgi:hypothetical protein